MRRLFFFTAYFVFCLSLLTASQSVFVVDALAQDDYVPPELITVNVPDYHPNFSQFKPRLGTYSYTVSWQGIPAATVTASIEQEGNRFKIRTQAETYTGIGLIYSLSYNAIGYLSAMDFSPISVSIDHKENSKHKTVEMTFGAGGEVNAVRETKGKDVHEVKFVSSNTLDPFGAAFVARAMPWEVGQTYSFDTFNGKTRYLVELTAEEKTELEVNDKVYQVWVISPKVKNLSYPNSESKLRKARIYMTADERREILEIESSVFIGSVYTSLDSFEPARQQFNPVTVAQAGQPDVFVK